MEEEIKTLKEKVEALTTQVTTLTGERDTAVRERDTLKTDNEKLGKDIIDKDKIIEQKTKDIVGARKEYKKLSEMTQAEKDSLTAAELELKERQEKLESDTKTFQDSQLAESKKQTEARRDIIINKMAGRKPEIIAKMKENWGKLDKSITDKATTEEEMTKVATDAWNMLGSIKPEAIRSVIDGGGGGEPAGGEKTDFTETPEGKALAANLGVDLSPVKAPEVKK